MRKVAPLLKKLATQKSLNKILKGLAYLSVGIFILTILLIMPLRWLNPSTTSFILRDENTDYFSTSKNWTPMEDINPWLPLAIIASEDQKFPDHFGFDIEALKKALSETRSRKRGASTITQQLVKNVYLWPGRSIFRKGLEAYLTLFMEILLPKERILEIYMNVVEFGPGIFGVATASKQHFNKAPSQLNKWESSLLAAVLPNPKNLSASSPSNYLINRASDIRLQMKYLGGTAYLKESGVR